MTVGESLIGGLVYIFMDGLSDGLSVEAVGLFVAGVGGGGA